jgi:hypothetical protein
MVATGGLRFPAEIPIGREILPAFRIRLVTPQGNGKDDRLGISLIYLATYKENGDSGLPVQVREPVKKLLTSCSGRCTFK